MTLRLPDKWVWDFWLTQDGSDYHIFYLQAPRSLGEESLRHWHVSIGHAVSQDLRNWVVLPDALTPAPNSIKAWDNYTTWTGSVIPHANLWYMFYTGTNRGEKGLVQRIGLATSKDLIHWEKHPSNPLIEADPQWYEMLDLTMWHDQAWRDPWVFFDDTSFHAFITARSNKGHKSARGVIAHVVSHDLVNWEVQPPVTDPGEFGQMEVPQLVKIEGYWYLLFCVGYDAYSDARRGRLGIDSVTGTHYMVGTTPLGPFRYLTDRFLVGDPIGSLYAGKVVNAPSGEWIFMCTKARTEGGGFIGEIADPMPLQVKANGELKVDVERETL